MAAREQLKIATFTDAVCENPGPATYEEAVYYLRAHCEVSITWDTDKGDKIKVKTSCRGPEGKRAFGIEATNFGGDEDYRQHIYNLARGIHRWRLRQIVGED